MKYNNRLVSRMNLVILAVSLTTFGMAQEPSAVPSAPPSQPELVVPAGTTLTIALSTFLNSRSTQIGDTFHADISYPVWLQQRQVIPRGSVIKGSVTHVQRPGRLKGKARIALRFETLLLPNGISRDLIVELRGIHGPGVEKIDRRTETVEMDSSKGRDTGEMAGNAGQGAIIGAIAGGGKGAGIGAGVGGVVGLATILLSRGNELVLEPGTEFDLVLRQPLRYAYGELEFNAQELSSARHVTRTRPRSNREQEHRPYFGGRRGFPIPWYTPWPWE